MQHFFSSGRPVIFWTAKGNTTIDELVDNIFAPNGYALVSAERHIIPILREVKPAKCKKVTCVFYLISSAYH